MESQPMKRCAHYQIYSEVLPLDGPPAYLAIRRCLLNERLVRFLRQSPEGEALAERMVIQADSGPVCAFVGPDLEAVTQHQCSVGRCEERCTPAYIEHLERFGLTDPHWAEVTCSEEEEQEAEAPCTSL